MLSFKQFLVEGPNRKLVIADIFKDHKHILFHREAIKGLSSAPNDVFVKAVKVIKDLTINPVDNRSKHGAKQLQVKGGVRTQSKHKTRTGKGAKGSEATPIYSISLSKYRIIFKLHERLVMIERFGARGDVYKGFTNVKEGGIKS